MTKRRPGHGEGSIHKRPDGRWAGVDDRGWRDGKRYRKYVYHGTQAEVIEESAKLKADRRARLPTPPERLTVEQYLREWIDTRQPEHLSPNTLDNYRWAIEKHLIPGIGKKRLRKLTPKEVADLLARRAEQGLGRSPRMRIRSVLAQALRQAEADGCVARNVATLITPTSLDRRVEGRTLSVPQAKRLYVTAAQDRLGAAIIVMLTMGSRPGEVLGLTWSNLDLEAGVLHVRQSLKRESSGLGRWAFRRHRARGALSPSHKSPPRP